MKRIIMTLVAALAISSVSFAESNLNNTEDVPIPLNEESRSTTDIPVFRAPTLIPIQACYMPVVHAICFTFSYPMGTLVCRLENLDTNEGRYAKIFSDSGVTTLPFLASPGHYRMALTTKSGQQYVGEFEVE